MRKSLVAVASALAAVSAWSAVEVADGIEVTRDDATGVVSVSYSLTATAGEAAGIVTADLIDPNGAVIAGALGNATGDVFRRVTVGTAHAFSWKPDAAAKGLSTGCSFRLTAWNLSSPPDYMAIDLTGTKDVTYYENAAQVPGGVKVQAYFLSKLLMRKIPAAQVKWHQGKASPAEWSGEQIQRWTTLTEDFYIGVYELTRGQHWFVDSAQSYIRSSTLRKTDVAFLMPAQGMNFNEFYGDGTEPDSTKWLGKAFEKTGVRLNLPTEAQWEYACRAGSSGTRYGTLADIAVYQDNAPKNASGKCIPAHGGTKLPNNWGLYDMIGNMFEYVKDWMNPEAHVDSSDATNPTGPAEYINFDTRSEELGHKTQRGSAGKMWRGGCYEYGNTFTTATYPYAWGKWGTSNAMQGFRLICPVQ